MITRELCDLLHHSAVSVQTSTVRLPSPYQSLISSFVQTVLGLVSTSFRDGRRSPLTRGRPLSPGRRVGGGSKRAASNRNRVIKLTVGASLTSCKNLIAAKLLSATKTKVRSGNQRATN